MRSKSGSYESHLCSVESQARQLSGMVLKTFKSKRQVFWVRLFITYIRPKLEYCCQSWNPTQRGLIRELESVQRRYTKRIPHLCNVLYEERLRRLNLPSLEQRQEYLDIAFVYRLLTGQFKISMSSVGL